MNTKTPFEMMMEQATKMASAFNPAMSGQSMKDFEALWPKMPKDMMEMTFGNGINKDGLDAKTRLLITLAGLTMLGAQSEMQLRLTVRHAIEAGAREQEILETIGQMAMFAGLPAMNRAIEVAKDVLNTNQTGDE